jgi:hypothetical protein
LAGTSALAFTIHVNSITTLKCNIDQTKNKRDIYWSYFFGGVVYETIGLLGSFVAIGNLKKFLFKYISLSPPKYYNLRLTYFIFNSSCLWR